MKDSTFKCLPFLQKVASVVIILSSLAFIAIGALIISTTQTADIFNMTFLVLGVLQFIVVVAYLFASNSDNVINCYLCLLTAFVSLQVIISAMAFAFQDDIINWILTNHFRRVEEEAGFEDLVRTRVTIALYFALGISVIQVFYSNYLV